MQSKFSTYTKIAAKTVICCGIIGIDMNRRGNLEQELIRQGASFVGFCRLPEGAVCIPGDINDAGILKYAVTIGIRLSGMIIEGISDRPTYTYFHHYRTVNALIDHICLRGLLMIEEAGYKAVAVPASQTVNHAGTSYCGLFPHKTAAVAAGLGWIGRNGLFISSRYGPRVRLGTILTDMPLCPEHNADAPGTMPQAAGGSLEGDVTAGFGENSGGYTEMAAQGCGDCRICVDSCPAMALTGDLWEYGCSRERLVDAKACSDYMNSHFKHIGRGSVCGICMKVCPYGQVRPGI